MTLSQKDVQLQSLQKEHLELMRQLTATQENLQTKEQSINQLETRYLELEAQLAELQAESGTKDDNIQYLQNEKIVLEVALQAARAEKNQLDEGAERLGEDVLVASGVLDQLKQEVQVKASQVQDNRNTVIFTQKQQKDLILIRCRIFDFMRSQEDVFRTFHYVLFIRRFLRTHQSVENTSSE